MSKGAKSVRTPLDVRFWRHVAAGPNGCWIWTGSLTRRQGYGVISAGGAKGRQLRAHRVAYELLRGRVPDGLVIDHLCRSRRCVNPDHMEIVTPGENVRRGIAPPAVNARKTHCSRGHEFSPENTYFPPSGRRHCRECHRARRAAHKD